MAKLDQNALQTTGNVAPEDSRDSMEGIEDMTLEDYIDELIEKVEALEKTVEASEKRYSDLRASYYKEPLELMPDDKLIREYVNQVSFFEYGSFGRSDIDYRYDCENEIGRRGIKEEDFQEQMDKAIAEGKDLAENGPKEKEETPEDLF